MNAPKMTLAEFMAEQLRLFLLTEAGKNKIVIDKFISNLLLNPKEQ